MSEMKVGRTHSLFLIMEEPEGTKGKNKETPNRERMNQQINHRLYHINFYSWGDMRSYEFQKLIEVKINSKNDKFMKKNSQETFK